MSKTVLIEPTTAANNDHQHTMRIPPFWWSPDPALCKVPLVPAPDGGQGFVYTPYPGSELAPRAIRFTLLGDPAQGDEIWITESTPGGGAPQRIHRLHAGRRTIVISAPIEGMDVEKDVTTNAIGVMSTGFYGSTPQQST